MSGRCKARHVIDASSLPSLQDKNKDFRDSSFFRCLEGESLPQLPSPSYVLQNSSDLTPGVVKLKHLNLAVKFGYQSMLRLEEAQTMIAIRAAFPNHEVPVPEVFGWRTYLDRHFIYMSLFQGQTVREAWNTLKTAEKEAICNDLSNIVRYLRRLIPNTQSRLIGSINGGVIQDRFFRFDYEKGPFSSVKSFNDWLFAAATRQSPKGVIKPGPYRDLIPDESEVYFTHGDLTIGNIIVSGPEGMKRIVGIIDWEQAGWYPEYWEYCKLLYGVEYSHEWRAQGWAEKIMDPFHDEMFAFGEFSLWRCP